MKYASVERCPVYGGRVRTFDPKDALSVAGVERVVEIPATPMPSGFKPLGGIAVIANNTWSAQQGRQRLKIEWDYGPNAGHDSTAYRAELEPTAREPGEVVRNQGDVDAALASAARRVSADYFVPHLAHAQMEVPNGVAGSPTPARPGRRRRTRRWFVRPSLRPSASTKRTSPLT